MEAVEGVADFEFEGVGFVEGIGIGVDALLQVEVVDGSVDDDAAQPGGEGEGGVVTFEVVEHLEEGLVHDFEAFVATSTVTHGHRHGIRKGQLIEAILCPAAARNALL